MQLGGQLVLSDDSMISASLSGVVALSQLQFKVSADLLLWHHNPEAGIGAALDDATILTIFAHIVRKGWTWFFSG